MNRDIAQQPYRVGIVPVPGYAIMSYACVAEPLRAANLLSGKTLFETLHFAPNDVAASSGAAAISDCEPIGADVPLDLLLVVAGGNPFANDDKALFGWLKKLARTRTIIGGVSGGPVILARAGVMAGRRMTVHWEHAAELAELHPDLMIEKRLYIIDRNRVTCGGGTAPLDYIHALLTERHGREFAHLVSDWFLHTDIRAASSPQRSGVLAGDNLLSPHLQPVVAAMQDHIGDPLSLVQLAEIAGISARQLNRVFSDALGDTAMAYYRRLRLDVGQRLVRGSPMGIASVAEATGFSSAAHFSAAYFAQFACRPTEDRRRAGEALRGREAYGSA